MFWCLDIKDVLPENELAFYLDEEEILGKKCLETLHLYIKRRAKSNQGLEESCRRQAHPMKSNCSLLNMMNKNVECLKTVTVILKVPYQLVKQNSRSTCHSTEKNLNSFNQQKTVLQVQAQYLTKSTFIRKMEVSIAKGTMFFGNVMSSTCLTSSQVQRHQEQKPMFPLSLQRT